MNGKWVFAIISAIIIIWVGYLVLTGIVYRWQFGGPFGDTFGALNALFSGLAMGGVIVAIFMQRQELILQRKELELTRQELTRSVSAQEGQAEALTRQYEILQTTAQLNGYTAIRGSGLVLDIDERIRELLGRLEEDEPATP